MKKLTLEIKPKIGFGELEFGDTTEKLTSYLGEAEEIENIEEIEDDADFNTLILNYWSIGITVFFEGVEKSVISCFETDNPEAMLFGKKIFELNEKEVIELMNANGFTEIEDEIEEEGEKRLSFDQALIDFFFEDDILAAINWGVLINDQGDIEEF
ncbi:MAG: hypothetical protein JEY97_10920 [Bacteroidales bacterium]|nr:hypothetical protein [Bacteroidales bacterium]